MDLMEVTLKHKTKLFPIVTQHIAGLDQNLSNTVKSGYLSFVVISSLMKGLSEYIVGRIMTEGRNVRVNSKQAKEPKYIKSLLLAC